MNIRKKLTSKQKQNKQKKTAKPKQPYTIQLAPGCPSLGFPYPVMYSPPPRTVKHVSFYTQKKGTVTPFYYVSSIFLPYLF